MMGDKINPVRKTDEEALKIAGKLLSATKYASLGVIDSESHYPLVSRVAACWSKECGFFFAASDLSVHSQCLLQNAKCSLLLGETGRGDGLAYARITLVGETARMDNDHTDRSRFREVFLSIHPKAELYIDFADFGFYPLKVTKALLNGGFGKAYHLEKADLALLNA